MRESSDGRLLIEVPDQLEAALAEVLQVAEVCPCFYLDGKAGAPDSLSQRQRERSRGDKVVELNRLGPAVLVVTGYPTAGSLTQVLINEVAKDAPELRAIFVAGMPVEEIDRLRAELSPGWRGRLLGLPGELPDLLHKIESRRRITVEGPALRIGSSLVPLQKLLRTEPPIDQDYLLLTTNVIRDPEASESPSRLLKGILAGRDPWRAFAHNLAWQRPTSHLEQVRQALQRLRSSDRRVQVIDVPAEPGAGLTVLLQQVAFEAARAGHPTLIHRSRGGEFDYGAYPAVPDGSLPGI